MRTFIVCATLLVLGSYIQILNAQEGNNLSKTEQLKVEKQNIVKEEKELLKKEVEKINDRLASNEITKEEAQELKEKKAKYRAMNIENRAAIVDNKIALLERNGEEYNVDNSSDKTLYVFGKKVEIRNDTIKAPVVYDIRTRTDLVVAFGLNNTITDGQSLDNSDYSIAGSRFFEIGLAWKTRVFKNSNFMRVSYGISYQSNGLKPTDNQYFVQNGNQTDLQDFNLQLDKSKFRMDNIVVPVYLEFGSSRVKEYEDRIRYSTAGQFKLGLGGFVGANISTRQKLKYKENGDKIKDKIKRDYNTSDLIYGVGGYIGFGDMSIYAKYDMSPIFKNAVVGQNNVSLGLRFDL